MGVVRLFLRSSLWTGEKPRNWVTELVERRMADKEPPFRLPAGTKRAAVGLTVDEAVAKQRDGAGSSATSAAAPARTLRAWRPQSPAACPTEYDCGDDDDAAAAAAPEDPPPLGPDDVVLAVDFLNSWHWCPAARSRALSMEPAVYAFLDAARGAGALVVHAVSDSKTHYLLDPAVAPHAVLAASVPDAERAPDGPKRDCSAYTRDGLTKDFEGPKPPVSLGVHLACGNAGRAIFDAREKPGSPGRKPAEMKGLKAEHLRPGDVVAAELDAVYAVVRRRRPKRVIYVGVHLELCILYSRWFSLLCVARWPGMERTKLAVVVPLVDVSNTDPDDPDVTRQVERDVALVERTACWIRCAAAPRLLGGRRDERVVMLDW